MAQTALDVANQGIVKGGGAPIADFEQNTPLAVLAKEDYPQKRALMLAQHRWVFAKTVVALTRLAEAPAGCPRAYAFQRPVGLVGQVHDYRQAARDDSAKVPCLQMADYIASDDPEVWVEFTADASEARWPAEFVEVVATCFGIEVANAKMRRSRAAELRLELYGNPEDQVQGGMLEAAKRLDSNNAPKRTLEWENGGALVEARLGGGGVFNDGRLSAALSRIVGA